MQKNKQSAAGHATTGSPRKAAIELFCRWQSRPGPLAPLIEEMAGGLSAPADGRLFLSLVHGVLRQKDALDQLIASFSSHPLSKMRPRTLWTLRIGFFQLLMLDRVPHQAAVDETVKAFRESRQPAWLTGFVNGLLRHAAGERSRLKKELAAGHLDEPLFSHPQWLVARWQKRFGKDMTAEVCRSNNTPPALVLCCNNNRIAPAGLLRLLQEKNVAAVAAAVLPNAIIVRGWKKRVEELPGFAQGLFWVQDMSSQLVASLLQDLPENSLLLDCCAGVGGKTAGLCHCSSSFSVVAVEPDPRRRGRLRETMERLGFGDRVTVAATTLDQYVTGLSGMDGAGSAEHGSPALRQGAAKAMVTSNDKEKKILFAGVLVDAPCSGLGVIRRHPDVRWNRTEGNLADLAANQLALLIRAAATVRENGILVYSVCSMEPEETFGVVDRFLASCSGFQLDDCSSLVPESARFLLDNAGRAGCFLSLPTSDMDGFFAVRFRHTVSAMEEKN